MYLSNVWFISDNFNFLISFLGMKNRMIIFLSSKQFFKYFCDAIHRNIEGSIEELEKIRNMILKLYKYMFKVEYNELNFIKNISEFTIGISCCNRRIPNIYHSNDMILNKIHIKGLTTSNIVDNIKMFLLNKLKFHNSKHEKISLLTNTADVLQHYIINGCNFKKLDYKLMGVFTRNEYYLNNQKFKCEELIYRPPLFIHKSLKFLGLGSCIGLKKILIVDSFKTNIFAFINLINLFTKFLNLHKKTLEEIEFRSTKQIIGINSNNINTSNEFIDQIEMNDFKNLKIIKITGNPNIFFIRKTIKFLRLKDLCFDQNISNCLFNFKFIETLNIDCFMWDFDFRELNKLYDFLKRVSYLILFIDLRKVDLLILLRICLELTNIKSVDVFCFINRNNLVIKYESIKEFKRIKSEIYKLDKLKKISFKTNIYLLPEECKKCKK